VINISITRKCKCCKEYLDIEKDNFVYYKKRYYHFDCAVNETLDRKNNKLSKEQCVNKFLDIQKENQKEVEFKIIKDKLFRWLHNTYNTVVLPKTFYVKMNDIFIGKYIGMSKGIPPEDLFDMWKRKKSELDRINAFNNKKGKVLIGGARIQYDLAILLSKYDSYLKWKEQQKIIEQERQQIKADFENKINFNKIYINKENDDSSFNISDILDEI